MPVYRGPDGKIIEERSHDAGDKRKDSPAGKGAIEEATRKINSRPAPPDAPRTAPAQRVELDDEVTRMVGRTAASGTPAVGGAEGQAASDNHDPVAGWLVIVDGPGRGQDFAVHYGQNTIGRAEGQAVRIDFGDSQISRSGHATVTYDPKGRKFYVQGGQGRSLTYLDGDVVLSPQELTDGQQIQLGETILKFVAFCGADFDWLED